MNWLKSASDCVISFGLTGTLILDMIRVQIKVLSFIST